MRQFISLCLLLLEIATAQEWVTAVIYGQTVSWIFTPLPTYPTPSGGYPTPTSIATPTPPGGVISSAASAASIPASQASKPVTVTVLSLNVVVTPSTAATTSKGAGGAAAGNANTRASSGGANGSLAAAGAAATGAAAHHHSGLSKGAKIGLGVGLGILGLLILLGLVFCCLWLRRRKSKKAPSSTSSLQEEPKAGHLSNSDMSVNNPEPVTAVPQREPTLPNIAETPALAMPMLSTGTGTAPSTNHPAMRPNSYAPIQNAIPVPNASEAAATVGALAASASLTSPNHQRYYQSGGATSSNRNNFDFGLGNQAQGGSMGGSGQHSIPRRPVGR